MDILTTDKELPARFVERDDGAAVWVCGVKSCGHELARVRAAGGILLAAEMVRRADGVWIKGRRHPFRAGRAWIKADSAARGEAPDFMNPAHTEIKQLEAAMEKTGIALSWNAIKAADFPVIVQCPCSKCRRLSKISSVRGFLS